MSGGTEKREQILPNVPIEDTGYILPEYDFAGNVPTPDGPEVHISSCGRLQCIIDAAKGILYYSDTVAFGQASSGLTAGYTYKKLGINFFTKTGLTCSNGAQMHSYFEGIPKGDGFGKKLQKVMRGMGMPEMRGIAPGILEDTQHAMNIKPVLQSAFGNVYPICEQVTLPVGDDYGQLQDPDPDVGDKWIKGSVQYINGRPYQTRWVQKKNQKGEPIYISKDEWDATPKTHNLDGTPKVLPPVTESFVNQSEAQKISLLLGVVFLCGAMVAYHCKK
jgi:hypothetical protein